MLPSTANAERSITDSLWKVSANHLELLSEDGLTSCSNLDQAARIGKEVST